MKRFSFLALLAGLFVGECSAGGYAQLGVTAQFGTPMYGVPMPVAPMYGAPVYVRQPVLLGYREVPTGYEICGEKIINSSRFWCMKSTERDAAGRVVSEKLIAVPKVPADLR